MPTYSRGEIVESKVAEFGFTSGKEKSGTRPLGPFEESSSEHPPANIAKINTKNPAVPAKLFIVVSNTSSCGDMIAKRAGADGSAQPIRGKKPARISLRMRDSAYRPFQGCVPLACSLLNEALTWG